MRAATGRRGERADVRAGGGERPRVRGGEGRAGVPYRQSDASDAPQSGVKSGRLLGQKLKLQTCADDTRLCEPIYNP